MLILHVVSLIIALFTLNYYISSKIETAIHRLLPMAVGLIAVYEICQILRLTVPNSDVVLIVEDILVLQMVYLLTHYILDFYYITLSKKVEGILAISMISVGMIALFQEKHLELYEKVYGIYVVSYLLFTVILALYIYRKSTFSDIEKMVVNPLCLALVMGGLSLPFRKVPFVQGRELVSACLMLTTIVAFYLMVTNQLADDATLMQMNVFDTAELSIVLFDRSFYLLGANEMARKTFPDTLDKAKREDLQKEYQERVKAFIESGRREGEYEVDGKFYRCLLEEFVYANKLRGYILTLVDNNEQKQEVLNLELQSMQKSKFLASMSHDFRSPLHAIIGASDILISKNNLTATNRSYVQMIQRSSNVLLGLVNEILLHSKLTAGKIELQNRPYSFETVLKELSQMMILNLNTKKVDFVLSFESPYPGEVIGDQVRVQEIIQNILSNAVKFTEAGSIQCRINCEAEPEMARVKFICEIEDTGIGMSEEQIKTLFDEYASYANLQKKDGTGLGMNIVKQLATLMNGDVWAKSDGQTGSQICVMFYQGLEKNIWCQPVKYKKEDLLKRTAKIEASDLPKVRFTDAKVLAVDDMEVNRDLFKRMTERWQIYPDVAASGVEAIEMVKEKSYHVIFLDLMMPEMDGMETAKRLREITDAPLILLTADASGETRLRCLDAGFADYMSKPIDVKQLERNFEKFIPREFCIAVERTSLEFQAAQSEENLIARRMILETTSAELEQLYLLLPKYVKEDLMMFRIKVHGIKGFTRQIHKYGISHQAEIMEMAAKTENLRFIEENLEDFLAEIRASIEEIKEELLVLPKRKVVVSDESKEELLYQVKEAFEEFDLKRIKRNLEQLKNRKLDEREQQLLEQLESACVEIDYEAGSSILEAYLK